MRPGCVGAALALVLAATACEEPVRTRSRSHRDARVAARPSRVPSLAPRFAPPTAAERAFDRPRRTALGRLVAALEATFRGLNQRVRRGAADPAFRRRWDEERRQYLVDVGRLRSQALAVDPLGTRSWGARVAARLVRDLEVRLPAAVPDSWTARPSGALSTARADFTLIWRQLRRYVSTLDNEQSKGSSP